MTANFLPTIVPIPVFLDLQSATLQMTSPEVCTFTEKVRDHVLAGEYDELTRLLEGKKISPSREAVGQIITGRAAFLGEAPSSALLENLMNVDTVAEINEAKSRKVCELIHTIRNRSDDKARNEAADELEGLCDPAAVVPLTAALGDRDYFVRWICAMALKNNPDPLAIGPLISNLKDEDDPDDVDKNVRSNARVALVEIGKDAVDPLIDALEEALGQTNSKI